MAAGAAALETAGRDIADLPAGEPGFQTAAGAVEPERCSGVAGRGANDPGDSLLRHANVATVPGEGLGAPNGIFPSCAAPPPVLEEGPTWIREGLARLA